MLEEGKRVKSTKSDDSGPSCVTVEWTGDTINVGHSQQPDAPGMNYNKDEWNAFLAGAKDGEFDLPA